MLTRRIYILFLVLAGLVIFSLDRIVTEVNERQESVRLNRLSVDLSRQCGDFFAARLAALKAARVALAPMAAGEGERRFAAVAAELFGALRGTRGVVLLDGEGQVVGRWCRGVSGNMKHECLAERQGLLGQFLSRMADSQTVVVSDALPLADGDYSLLAVARVDGPDSERACFVAAEFRIRRPVQASLYLDELADSKVVLEDSAGNSLHAGEPAGYGGRMHRAFFTVADTRWSLRVQGETTGMTVAAVGRTTVWGLGVVLILVCSVFCFVLSEKSAALADRNQDLARQMGVAAEANRKLLEANKELDDFTYVVAHDLKEPLRGIEALTAMLADDKGKAFDDSTREYLGFIKKSGARMHRLVDDLLRLSRISRRRYPLQRVDFGELVTEVRDTLRVAAEGAGASIAVAGELPVLVCDRVRVAELFQNLMSNALKFVNGRAPVVEIGYKHAGTEHCFWVKDNGMGVPAEDRERVFQIFQRGRTSESIEGTGIGLTICRRIVEHHHGRIWLESEEGAGCTVFFTLGEPLDEPAGFGGADSAKGDSHE